MLARRRTAADSDGRRGRPNTRRSSSGSRERSRLCAPALRDVLSSSLMRRAFCAIVLLALVCLLPRAARVAVGGDYVDSSGKVTARDAYQTPIPPFTRRLPLVLIAALATGLIFLWGAETTSVTAGACAALLVVSNHLFHTLSTLAMTDAMLVAFTTAAVYSI